VLRPDEGVEPGEVCRVRHVERVEIQAGPPHDLGKPSRRRHPSRRAHQDRLAITDHLVAVAVGIPVRIEAQPAGCADLQQRERLRQPGEHRQQNRTPPSLVRLHDPDTHLRLDLRPVRHREATERGRILDRTSEQADDAEQQIRLPFRRRERAEQCEHFLVTADRQRWALVCGRHAACLPLGELGIRCGDRHIPMIRYSSHGKPWHKVGCSTSAAEELGIACPQRGSGRHRITTSGTWCRSTAPTPLSPSTSGWATSTPLRNSGSPSTPAYATSREAD
jgi:hypothetical protein